MREASSADLEQHFDFRCIDKRRQAIFMDISDLVFNAQVLGEAYCEQLKQCWAIEKECALKQGLSLYFHQEAIQLTPASQLSLQSMFYEFQSGKQKYLIKTSAYLSIPDALLLNHFLAQSMIDQKLDIPVAQSQLCFLKEGELIQRLEKIPGTLVRHQLKKTAETAIRIPMMQKLAEMLLRIHGVSGRKFGALSVKALVLDQALVGLHDAWYDYLMLNFERHLAACIAHFQLTHQQAKSIWTLFETHRDLFQLSKVSLLHGDFSKNNLLIKDGEVSGVLDWEDALLGDPLFELAHLSMMYDTKDFEVLFQAYLKAGTIIADDTLRIKLYLYRLRLYVSKTVFSACVEQSGAPKSNKLLDLYEQTRALLL